MDKVTRLASEKGVVLFSKSSCCMCYAVKILFQELGVTPTVHELDQDPEGWEMEKALMRLGCNGPVPAIFIGGKRVGSTNEVMSLHLRSLAMHAGARWMQREGSRWIPKDWIQWNSDYSFGSIVSSMDSEVAEFSMHAYIHMNSVKEGKCRINDKHETHQLSKPIRVARNSLLLDSILSFYIYLLPIFHQWPLDLLSEHMKCSLCWRRPLELEVDLLAVSPNKFHRGLIEASEGRPNSETKTVYLLSHLTYVAHSTYTSSMTIASLKQKIIAEWPQDKTVTPKSINDLKLIHAGKVLENNKSLADSRITFGDLPAGVITMHVVVQPAIAKNKTEKSKEDMQKPNSCRCVIL
ncbi:hypothetical protein V6N12_001949 [Hibiscus sabdariffa]|uniref:Ubiquitin-like domain-containing protein n=1 Tax=Hibiscus sabdariffa TaxID=183260 RepID=A0ABR2BRW5_9ROSI